MLRNFRTLLLACAVAIGIFSIGPLLPSFLSASWVAPAAAVDFIPPDAGKPNRIEGAGTRARIAPRPVRGGPIDRERDVIVGGQKLPCPLTAYLPKSEFGLTTRAYPTFLVHMPELPDDMEFTARFVLTESSSDKEVYRSSFPVLHRHRTIEIHLPDNANVVPLEVADRTNPDSLEKPVTYEWNFTLSQASDNSNMYAVKGTIERVNLVEDFVRALATASKSDRVELYAETGIWYDAISSLYELLKERPDDLRLGLEWKQMLDSVGLGEIAEKPIFF